MIIRYTNHYEENIWSKPITFTIDCDCDNCSITQFAKLIKDLPMTEKEVSMLTTRFLEKLLILSRNETKFCNARDLK